MKRLIPHLVVILTAALQFSLYRAWHSDEAELQSRLEDGSPAEKVYALHVLTNRGSSPHTARSWDRHAIGGLMTHPDPLVADFAYTVDVCRMSKPRRQNNDVLKRLDDNFAGTTVDGEAFSTWLRHFLFFRRKVAGRHMGAMLRLKNDELRWLIAAIAEEELDGESILESIHQRQTGANLARTRRMVPADSDTRQQNVDDARSGTRPDRRQGGQLPGAKGPGGR